ncbi:MAG: Holliday junction resolvase RuvX [Planctomycetota bacterium]|jgi:putative Holliday junction resolvase
MRGKLLAIDYGTKRIGLAVSSPLETVHPRPRRDRVDPASDLAYLVRLADEEDVVGIVIGLPHHMDGAQSEMEAEARAFAAKLAAASGLPVFGSDERLTSQEAERILAGQHKDPRERKGRVDSAAACLLLQDFLAAGDEPERIA